MSKYLISKYKYINMFSLGHKKLKPKFLGHKNYHFNNLGHKIHEKGQNPAHLKSTSDGVIDNYSFYPLYEPIKGVNVKTNKSNKFNVEKPKKINNFGSQNYV